MNKKRLSVFLAVVMTVTVMSGCGKKNDTAEYTEDGRMIITIAKNSAIVDNSPVEQYLEEKYNVEIKTYGYASSYYDKLATMFASKEIPDVMFINDISNWEPLVKQGVLAPISLDTVKEAAPDHYKHINEQNEKMWELGKVNGELYAIPKSMGNEYNVAVVWNNDWLKAVGVDKIPETLEEFEAAFEKLKNGDPDGNGLNDTYPVSGAGGNYYSLFDWVFGAYGVMPEQWTLQDGKVINGTVTERAKEALTKLHEWYEKGYIHPEFLTDDANVIVKRFTQKGLATQKTTLNHVSDKTPQGRANFATLGEDYKNMIVYGPLPEGPYGNRGAWLWGPLSNFVCFGAHMKDNVEKQKVILQILNDCNFNEEVALMVSYGPEGEGYTIFDESVGKSSGINQVEKYASDANARAELGIGFFNIMGPAGHWADASVMNLYKDPEYVAEVKQYNDVGDYQDLLMRATTASSLQYSQAVQQVKINAYAAFIIGHQLE